MFCTRLKHVTNVAGTACLHLHMFTLSSRVNCQFCVIGVGEWACRVMSTAAKSKRIVPFTCFRIITVDIIVYVKNNSPIKMDKFLKKKRDTDECNP